MSKTSIIVAIVAYIIGVIDAKNNQESVAAAKTQPAVGSAVSNGSIWLSWFSFSKVTAQSTQQAKSEALGFLTNLP